MSIIKNFSFKPYKTENMNTTNEEYVNEPSNRTQCGNILNHMMTIGPITQVVAYNEYGCFRLASRIHDLRSRGENIVTEKITLPNGKCVAQYSIVN